KNFLKPELSILENLHFYAKLQGSEILIPSALAFFNLSEIADRKIKTLSMGWQRRVMLAKLLCCPATIWLLDEPTNNLDKEGKEKLKGLIETKVKEGSGLVIITSHDEFLFDLGVKLNMEDFI
ncbi:MAG: ATP-binding cassette domain-containing protein, partial [Pelagibacterales bacterium]|nr:ATP-binding cassette domain-containing protein [Pelagibacterales bacterium]